MRKDIEYYEKTYTVRDWVKYVATDDDGLICGYESIPHTCGGCWVPSDDEYLEIICQVEGVVENFRATLRGV